MEKKLMLQRLQPKFKILCLNYMAKEELNQNSLARVVGLQRPHVNALLSGRRPLSAYYLFKFIQNGVFQVADINDEQPESEKEADFWRTATEAENIAMLKRIARLRRKGVNIEALLDAVDA